MADFPLSPSQPKQPRLSRRMVGLSAELLLIFGVFPAYVAFARPLGLPRAPWPLLLLIAAIGAVFWLVRRSGMTRRQFWAPDDRTAERRHLRTLLIRFAIGAVLLTAFVALFLPDKLLLLPRTRPERWLGLLFFYPVFSVYPQELLFRAFFLRRYQPLLTRPALLVLANAIAFGWAHVFFPTPLVGVTLTFFGGLLFADTYRKTGSLRLAVLEHALYGNLVFTIGLGEFFFGGGGGRR